MSSIPDILAALQQSGVDVIYSSDLITPAMPLAKPL
jgi:hypothetical protein